MCPRHLAHLHYTTGAFLWLYFLVQHATLYTYSCTAGHYGFVADKTVLSQLLIWHFYLCKCAWGALTWCHIYLYGCGISVLVTSPTTWSLWHMPCCTIDHYGFVLDKDVLPQWLFVHLHICAMVAGITWYRGYRMVFYTLLSVDPLALIGKVCLLLFIWKFPLISKLIMNVHKTLVYHH